MINDIIQEFGASANAYFIPKWSVQKPVPSVGLFSNIMAIEPKCHVSKKVPAVT